MASKSAIVYLKLALVDGEDDQPFINKITRVLHHHGMLGESPSRATLHIDTGDKELELLAKFEEPVSLDKIRDLALLSGWEVIECASTEQESLV